MKAFEKQRPDRLRFDSFELDLETGELQKNGRRVRLQDQPARLLILLASRAGELVTRSEIQKTLWEEGRFVEFEHAVNTAIKKVREALEDDPESPKIIETLPRKGYRFIAAVIAVKEAAAIEELVPPTQAQPSIPPASEPSELQLRTLPDLPITPEKAEPVPTEVRRLESNAVTKPVRVRFSLVAAALLLLVLAIVAAAAMLDLKPSTPVSKNPELRLEVMTPPTADPTSLAISPDGLKIVFVAISEGRSQLRLRWLDSGMEKSLPGTDGALFPFWSPRSESVAFFADGFLKRTDIDGGLPRMLADAPAGRGGAWNADDVILFTPNTGGPIFKVLAGGGEATAQTQVTAGSHRHPRFLPDARHFLYFVTGASEGRGVYLGDLRGVDPPKQLVPQADAAAEYASSQLLFISQGTLFAQTFDAATLALSGYPTRVAELVTVDAAMNLAAVSASGTGSIVYRAASAGGQRQLVWFDRKGREIEPVGAPDSGGSLGPSISSDGQHIALYRTVDGNSDIWLLGLDRGVRERFTMDTAGEVNPVWSPDRRRIAFSSNREGAYDLYVKAVSGAETELLLKTADPKSASSWSRDGRHLLFRTASPDTNYDIWALPFDTAGKPGKAFSVVQTKAEEREAEFSPNGKWIAYQSTASSQSEVYVQPFPARAGSILLPVSINGGAQPRWGSDSELFYIALDGQMMSVTMHYRANGREIQPDSPVALFPTRVGGAVHSNDRQQYVVSPDGKRFLMNTLTEASSPITVILNWKNKA